MGAFCRWARFDFSIFGDAPERASTADMTVDAGEAAAHARGGDGVSLHRVFLAGLAFGFAVFVNVYVMIAWMIYRAISSTRTTRRGGSID